MAPFNYGNATEDYPVDFMDDFDARIEKIEYDTGEYGAQVFVMLRPEGYEYEVRGDEPVADDEQEGLPREWWGMGKRDYEISDDGMDILSGPKPTRSTNIAKGFIALTAAMGVESLPSDLTALNTGEQVVLHWKRVDRTFKIQGEERVSNKLFPSGPGIGKAVWKEAGEDKKGKVSSATTASTRKAKKAEETEEEAPAPAPATATRRGRRGAAKKAEETPAPAAPPVEEKQEEEDPVDVLVKLIETFGDDGLDRGMLAQAVLEAELPVAVSNRSNVNKAVKAGRIEITDDTMFAL